MKARYVPQRGDLVWLSFSSQAGHEQAGQRPGLVVSPASYNRVTGLALVCPVTSRVKGYPFETALPAGGPVQGAVLADQVRSMDWRVRKARRVSRLAQPLMEIILRRLGTLLDPETEG